MKRFFIVCFTLLLIVVQALADSTSVNPFSGLGQNVYRSFIDTNGLLHIAGIAATYALIETDVDYRVHCYFQKHAKASQWFMPVTITGGLGPLALGVPLYFMGKHKNNADLTGAGSCVLQSLGVSLAYISVLKAITGRTHPDTAEYTDMQKASRDFKFGFFRRGIFWGWPSGHAGVTMAVASSLAAYYPDNQWVRYGALAMVLYTTVGVAAVGGGHMHWFSDAIAGDLMGYAIGTTIGRYYRARVDGMAPGNQKLGIQASPNLFSVVYTFK